MQLVQVGNKRSLDGFGPNWEKGAPAQIWHVEGRRVYNGVSWPAFQWVLGCTDSPSTEVFAGHQLEDMGMVRLPFFVYTELD